MFSSLNPLILLLTFYIYLNKTRFLIRQNNFQLEPLYYIDINCGNFSDYRFFHNSHNIQINSLFSVNNK